MNRYYYIIFLILLGACKNSEPQYQSLNYQSSNTLKGNLLNDSFLFSDPMEMICLDSLLIIHDSQKQDYCFHIFNSKNGNFIKSFGSKGKGPGEIIFPESMNYSTYKKAITTYDPNLRKIVIYNINHILNNHTPYFTEIKITETPGFILQALPYKNTFIVRGADEKMRFGILDSLNKVYAIYNNFPNIVPEEEENRAITNYTPQCAIRPDGTKMVSATYIGSNFEILTIKERNMELDTIQFYYPPIYNIIEGNNSKWIGTTPETIIGCHNIYVTDNFIYTIYEGEAAKKNNIHKKLIIFNWEGAFYKYYLLEEGDPICICADEKNNTLYCIIRNKKYEYQIYRYDNKS